jgi:nitroreductase family protein
MPRDCRVTAPVNSDERRSTMPITDAMRARHVVRQYLDKPLPDDVVAALRSRIEEDNRAQGTDIRLLTGGARVFGPMWGTVRARSVRNCLVMAGPDASDLDERLGYGGADLMLTAQELGLNTWWVGGTFSKKAAARASGATGRVVAVVALGYGATQGVPHTSKRPDEVASYDGEAPVWFTQGVEAALLAPTAFGKQAFTLAGSGNEVTIRCQESAYAGQDRGLVKYHFEAGAGRDNFVWAP